MRRETMEWLREVKAGPYAYDARGCVDDILAELKRLRRIERAARKAADMAEKLVDPEIGENTRGAHRDPLLDVVDELRVVLKKGARK